MALLRLHMKSYFNAIIHKVNHHAKVGVRVRLELGLGLGGLGLGLGHADLDWPLCQCAVAQAPPSTNTRGRPFGYYDAFRMAPLNCC